MDFQTEVLSYLKSIDDQINKIGAILVVLMLIALYFLIHTIWGII
jgi:hypothetical protein